MWTDATTYSRDGEKKQTAWALKLPSLRISITNAHIYNRGVFTMHCHQLGFDTYNLQIDGSKVEEAKEKAITLCKMRAMKLFSELDNVNNPQP